MPDDDALLATWLHGRPAATKRSYRAPLGKLRLSLAPKALFLASLEDLQRHIDGLAALAPRSQALAIAAIKSFYGFHQACGTLAVNPSAGLQGVTVPGDLAQRIVAEPDISKLLCAAEAGRDRAMLELLYGAGLRISELCSLYWRALVARTLEDGTATGQVTVTGKGGKTRAVLLGPEVWRLLVDLKVNERRPIDPVFPSDRDPAKPIGQRQVLRIVKRAAIAAGLDPRISNHWLRHSHVSHALDHGAPIQLVRDTVGHASLATTNTYAHAKPGASSASYLKRGE
jgi:integrase/recombinase XerD